MKATLESRTAVNVGVQSRRNTAIRQPVLRRESRERLA